MMVMIYETYTHLAHPYRYHIGVSYQPVHWVQPLHWFYKYFANFASHCLMHRSDSVWKLQFSSPVNFTQTRHIKLWLHQQLITLSVPKQITMKLPLLIRRWIAKLTYTCSRSFVTLPWFLQNGAFRWHAIYMANLPPNIHILSLTFGYCTLVGLLTGPCH